MRFKGKITQWNDAKGFGFIQPMQSGEKVFFHIKSVQNRSRRPVLNEVVTYSVAKDGQGRLQAQAVTFAGEKLKVKKARSASNVPLSVSVVFFLLLALACWAGRLHPYFLAAYVGLSLLTFLSYAWDKHKAKRQSWRTPESTLHLLSLAGGWPGALLAQSRLRHKSATTSFLTVFWLTVVVNLAALYWLAGQPFLL